MKKKKDKRRKIWHKIKFVTNITCKGIFFPQIKEKLNAFWDQWFGNFYFNPVLWNDRV